MTLNEVIDRQAAELRARGKEILGEGVRVKHVGGLHDTETGQHVMLWRIERGALRTDELGPYDAVNAVVLYDFWGDAAKRGEVADVFVFNGVDAFQAVDPADEWAAGTHGKS